jgi:hypothetical protein
MVFWPPSQPAVASAAVTGSLQIESPAP